MLTVYPKTLGGCVDRYDRLDAKLKEIKQQNETQVKKLSKELTELHAHILGRMNEEKVNAVSGKMMTATRDKKTYYSITAWKDVTAYCKKTGDFEVLQHRLSVMAMKERIAEGRKIPGTKVTNERVLKLTKKRK